MGGAVKKTGSPTRNLSRAGDRTLAERKSFLLRVDPTLLEAVQRWANDDLRSLNGQIEFLLRRALKQSGRGPGTKTGESETTQKSEVGEEDAGS